jgi:hypothetical protein
MWLMKWPLARHPHLLRWYEQIQARPSFQQSIVDCEPPGMRTTFGACVAARRKAGTSVADRLE